MRCSPIAAQHPHAAAQTQAHLSNKEYTCRHVQSCGSFVMLAAARTPNTTAFACHTGNSF